jgi:hypothetical protein
MENKETKIIYTGKNGYDIDKEHADKYLKVGETYTLERADVGNWRTEFYLKEFPGKSFNSVHFKPIKDSIVTFDSPLKHKVGNDGFGFDEGSTYPKSEVFDSPLVEEQRETQEDETALMWSLIDMYHELENTDKRAIPELIKHFKITRKPQPPKQ